MKNKTLEESMNCAIKGIIHSLRTQRNMRIHCLAAVLIIILSVFLKLNRFEFMAVTFSIFLVCITEMMNTAIESVVDLVTDEFHQLAKIAKDVAAGAVFLSSVNAVIIGYLVFFYRFESATERVFERIGYENSHLSFIAFGIVFVIVIALKTLTKAKNYLKGGLPSGHTALAFALSTMIAILVKQTLISILAFTLAFIVGESRVECKIHSKLEVLMGGIVGIITIKMIFYFFLKN